MSKTIDDKVVSISFENQKFEQNVRGTITSLDKLKTALKFGASGKSDSSGKIGTGFLNTSKGLGNLNSAINQAQLGQLNSTLSTASHKLGVFRLASIGALAEVGGAVVSAGAAAAATLAKIFVLGPIQQGLDIYQTKLQAIQTILANTQAAGTKMSDVTKALAELNVYSNKTIYSFGEMTRNIGTFTAAGVALKPAVASIKGIANLAALSGSNSQQASTAMYQLSQAISAGQVHLQDWNSVVNAGMGGAVFQRALATTAVAMGKIKDSSLKLVGPMKNVQIAGQSFRQSLQNKTGQTWLTSDVLTKTLATFTGDMTNAQLAAEGFNKEQIKQIQQTAKTALNAATQVKTFSQLMDVSKETIATGWAGSFELIIGNLNEAKKLFTGISNVIGNWANASAKARNSILSDWKKLGGRTALFNSLKNVFVSLGEILKPIREAFRDIFPRKTGQQLADLSQRLEAFTNRMHPSAKTIDELRRIFRGLFAILDFGKMIIYGLVGSFIKLSGAAGIGSGGILSFLARMSDFITSLDNGAKKSSGLQKGLSVVSSSLNSIGHVIHNVAHALVNMFSGFSTKGFNLHLGAASKALHPFQKAINILVQALQHLGPAINNAIGGIDWEAIASIVQTGLFGAFVLMVHRFVKGTTLEKSIGIFGKTLGNGLAKNFAGGALNNIGKTFGTLNGSLKAMETQLKAKALEEIAIAIALLVASLVALSFVNPLKLDGAIIAMSSLFAALIFAMKTIDDLASAGTLIKLPIIAASFILLATAIDILTISIVILSRLSFKDLVKGLGALIIVLEALVAASGPLGKNAAGMIRSGIAITILAVGLNLMAKAVKSFGSLDLKTIGKGLLGVAGALDVINLGMKSMPAKGLYTQALAMGIIGKALITISEAVKLFGSLDTKTLGKGLLGVAVSLTAIGLAMDLMPKNMLLISAGLFIVAESLGTIMDVVRSSGKMSFKTLAVGIWAIGTSLLVLALGLDAMTGSLAGAAALTLAAAGLSLLIPALVLLGHSSWTSIIKGLVGLGGAMAIIALSALALLPSIPALLGFGAALIVIGAGLTLAGSGIFLIGLGLSSIAIAGPTAVSILVHALIDLSKAVAEIGTNLVKGILQIVAVIAKMAAPFAKAIIKIISQVSEIVIKGSPKISEAIVTILVSALNAIYHHLPDIIKAGVNIVKSLLKGIYDNIDQLVKAGLDVIERFLYAIAKNIIRVENAAFQLIVKFIEGIGKGYVRIAKAGLNAVVQFISGLGKGLVHIVKSGLNMIAHLLTGIGNGLTRITKAGGNAIAHFLTGISNAGVKIADAGTNAMIKFINALVKDSVKLYNAGFKAIIKFINGIADSIEKNVSALRSAGEHLAFAIADGMTLGLASKAKGVLDKAKSIGSSIIHGVGSALGINSPAKEMVPLGAAVVEGLVLGMNKNHHLIGDSTTKLKDTLTSAFSDVATTNFGDIQPTIRPVLDLTEVRKGAAGLSGLINKTPLGTVSLDQATTIAIQKTSGGNNVPANTSPKSNAITFEQNNYSPEALSAIEIYRHTRNGLSQLKSAIDASPVTT